jgi:hypothetical protein
MSSLLEEVKNLSAVINHPLLGGPVSLIAGGEVEEVYLKTTWGGFNTRNYFTT